MQTIAEPRGGKLRLRQVLGGPGTIGIRGAAHDAIEGDDHTTEVGPAANLVRCPQAAEGDVAKDEGFARGEPLGSFDLAPHLPGSFAWPEAGFEAEIALLKTAEAERNASGLVASGIADLCGGYQPGLIGVGQGPELNKRDGLVLAINAVGAELKDKVIVRVLADAGVLVMTGAHLLEGHRDITRATGRRERLGLPLREGAIERVGEGQAPALAHPTG